MQAFLYAPRESTEKKVGYGPVAVGRWGVVSDFQATRPDGTAPPAGTGIRFDKEGGLGLISPGGQGDLVVEAKFTPSEAFVPKHADTESNPDP
jgi:hypothetical protein